MIRVYVEGLGVGGGRCQHLGLAGTITRNGLWSLKLNFICRQVFSIGIGERMPAMAQLQHDVAGHAVVTEKR